LFNTDKRLSSKDTRDEEKRSLLVKWKFSINRFIIKGRNGVCCIEFGPGNEIQDHATNEIS
jgi:hypothetical protein